MEKLGKALPASEITPEALYLRRREFIKNAALFTATAASVGGGLLWLTRGGPPERHPAAKPPQPAGPPEPSELVIAKKGQYTVNEPKNSFEEITTYNNFYE